MLDTECFTAEGKDIPLSYVLNHIFVVTTVDWRQVNPHSWSSRGQHKQQVALLLWFLVQYLSILHIWWTKKYDKIKQFFFSHGNYSNLAGMEPKLWLWVFNLVSLQEDSNKLQLSFQCFILESGGSGKAAQQKKDKEEVAAIKNCMPNKDQI